MCEQCVEHMAKWTYYEQKYILPCFTWAEEQNIDLKALMKSNPGKNCVQLLVEELVRRTK